MAHAIFLTTEAGRGGGTWRRKFDANLVGFKRCHVVTIHVLDVYNLYIYIYTIIYTIIYTNYYIYTIFCTRTLYSIHHIYIYMNLSACWFEDLDINSCIPGGSSW